ncbi:MAG: hypothetical protein EHM42_13180 [Planctomycetaceae bacterium]|nr:MAG: hypothetical protein EHM42_13180 [Planctomycetaceae bacterium]
MNVTTIRGLFTLAALYDGILGLLFLVAPAWAFTQFGITPPNHFGYVQFSAALLLIFSLMFLRIAQQPHQQAPLILYGILLKLAYCGVAFGYWFTTDIPWIWKPFAVIDLVMLGLFAWAWKLLHKA